MTNQLLSLSILQWSARVLSILAVGVILMFAIGEGLNLARFTPRELLLFLFFPLGVGVGMALAWRWEALGGGITVASLAGFYLADRLMSSSFPRGIAFLVIAAPGFLFLLHWLLARPIVRQHV
jgi:hypothetical protein